nr:platelet endothelial aggregation receptor 1 isoform X3 [Macaca fascicularis]
MSLPLCPLLLLAVGLRLAGTLNPSDPNTCSFWESFTTTTKESHSRPFSLLPSEPCERPWEGPHTCPQPTVVYRTVYRQVVKTDHRQRLQCCHGFYESRGFCVPLCAQECVHGRCVAPNQCQCVPGWRGDDCSSECAPGMWGPQCDKPCSCGNNSSCDPKSGECSCPSGLQPPNCLQPCTPGYYGPACQFRCQCHGARCDPQTGACFCPAERTGPRAPSAPCPAQRAFMDPAAPRNVAATTAASVTDSLGSAAALRVTLGIGAGRSARWAALGRTVLRRATALRTPVASRPMAHVCANTASLGTAAPSASAPTASTVSAARPPAPATRSTASGGLRDKPKDQEANGEVFGAEVATALGPYPSGTGVTEGEREGPRGPGGAWGTATCPNPGFSIARSLPSGPLTPALCESHPPRRGVEEAGLPRPSSDSAPPRLCPQLPPDERGVLLPAGLGGPSLQRELPAGHPRAGVPGTLSLPARRRLPGYQRPLSVRAWLHGEARLAARKRGRWRGQGMGRSSHPLTLFQGPHCASLCPPDTYGVNCSARCSCENAIACSPIDGECVCKEGWQRGNCSVPCPPGTWGFGCNASCQCAHEAVCSPQTGACTCTPGWHGARCQLPCPKGQFGEGCASHCDCDHSDGCDPVHGRCQCQAGWMGTRCHLSCPEGLWGVNCSNTCTCKNGGTCLPENGNCVCAPGFRGPSCQRSCPPGHWGENCAQTCQCHHGGTCHPQDGSCICPLGWTGHHCLEGCPLGTFGANCSQPCQCGPGEKCHPETGACVCPPGHSGAPCRIGIQEPFTVMPTTPVAYNSLGAVIGIAVLGSLVVALVALFIGYRHWQKGKEHHHLAVAYSSGRLDGSEYVMPDVPPSYSHYYSNPSYHTLSQCSPNPPPANKVPGPLFASLQAPERTGGAHRHDNHTTLPADWKHRREPPPGPLDRGSSRLDRSYSYSYNNGPGPFYNKGLISEEELGASVASLSSENPYATIRDLPSLPGGPRESSYMEMKGPPSGSPPRQPPQFWDSQRRRQPQPQRDSGTYEQPSPLIHDRDPVGSQPPLLLGLPPGHYDSPKNSHIPGHYDLPPVRHPPSPPLRRQDR